MVVEKFLPPFPLWLSGAVLNWLGAALAVTVLASFVAYVILSVRRGPVGAAVALSKNIWDGLVDLAAMSPRRVRALSWLAIKESLHRLVLVVFAVFLVILLFAGWYLDQRSDNIMELYLSFVMTTTSYLVLLLALFLSVFSLPTDITKRTLHTIVTKPVRPSEVIVGRVLGFAAIGTVILAATALVSYVFVTRGLNHRHQIVAEQLEEVPAAPQSENPVVRRGQTTEVQSHQHEIVELQDGTIRVNDVRGHSHEVSKVERNGQTVYEVGPPSFPARVPVYGQLTFKDRTGAASAKGINVGDEWSYRQYIEGGTAAAGVWRFEGLGPDSIGDGLSIELTIQVFRTHKGIISRPITGAVVLRNPDTGLASEDRYFAAREYYADTHFLPRKLLDRQGNAIDIYNDLVHNGALQIEITCLDPQQFLGMAQGDLYLRQPDASFTGNFFKGYVGIWLQMTLVICLGVMFSTFLNGSVAMLATLGALIGGFCTGFMLKLSRGEVFGGGPLEQFVRMVNQQNLTSELDPGLGSETALMIDQVLRWLMGKVALILPDFLSLSHVDYVAHGYAVPTNTLLIHTVQSLAYFLPLIVAGYFFFRSREVAR